MDSEKEQKLEEIDTATRLCERTIRRVQAVRGTMKSLQTNVNLTNSLIRTCEELIENIPNILTEPNALSTMEPVANDVASFKEQLEEFQCRYDALQRLILAEQQKIQNLKNELQDLHALATNTTSVETLKLVEVPCVNWLNKINVAEAYSMDIQWTKMGLLDKVVKCHETINTIKRDKLVNQADQD